MEKENIINMRCPMETMSLNMEFVFPMACVVRPLSFLSSDQITSSHNTEVKEK